jgi:hypothetical protein
LGKGKGYEKIIEYCLKQPVCLALPTENLIKKKSLKQMFVTAFCCSNRRLSLIFGVFDL